MCQISSYLVFLFELTKFENLDHRFPLPNFSIQPKNVSSLVVCINSQQERLVVTIPVVSHGRIVVRIYQYESANKMESTVGRENCTSSTPAIAKPLFFSTPQDCTSLGYLHLLSFYMPFATSFIWWGSRTIPCSFLTLKPNTRSGFSL